MEKRLAFTLFTLVAALTFGGLGVQANPDAPSARDVLVYAPTQADYFGMFDAKAVLPPALKFLRALPGHKLVGEFPEIKDEVNRMLGELEMGIGMAKSRLRFDVTTDVDWIAGFVSLKDGLDSPHVLIVARGKFPDDAVTRIGSLMGMTSETLDGRPMVRGEGRMGPMIATGADGALLFGTPDLVEPRAKSSWKGKARKKVAPTSFTGVVTELMSRKPFLAFVSRPSEPLRDMIGSALRGQQELAFLSDFLRNHTHFALAFHHDGVSWRWGARSKDGLRVAELASRGLIDVMRAGHLATRGFIRVFLAGLHSYEEVDPRYATVVKHMDFIIELVSRYTGDGNFKAAVKIDKRKRTLKVDARGKSLAEVFPIGALAGTVGAGAAFFMFQSMDKPPKSEPPKREAPQQPAP
ncbi:MAG: hypothetical protein ACI9OJ_001179 [Myxococcota bacterium]|jgi:hypothetical protein